MSESIEYYIVHVISLKEHILSDFGNKNKKIVYITKTWLDAFFKRYNVHNVIFNSFWHIENKTLEICSVFLNK
jgi:hypothetical protein